MLHTRLCLAGLSTRCCTDNAESVVTVSVTVSVIAGVNVNVTVMHDTPDGVFDV